MTDEPGRILKARFAGATHATEQAALADAMNRRAAAQLARIHARRPGDAARVVKSLDEIETDDLDQLDPHADGATYRDIWRCRDARAEEKARAGATLAALAFRAWSDSHRFSAQ